MDWSTEEGTYVGDESEVVKYSVRTPIPRRYLKVDPSGRAYYISPGGDDGNPGTKESPFRTIQRCADIAQAGDTCFVREGTFRETVRPMNGGRVRDPIKYVAFPGEKVTLNGTDVVSGEWSAYQGAIYQTKVTGAFEQLFVDGQMMIEARWPNMRLEQIWDRSCWANTVKGSRYGQIVDPELVKTDVDWTGAIATLNVAHRFLTWTRRVNSHTPGGDSFSYNRDMEPRIQNSANATKPWEDNYYYLTGKLGALDSPGEWFHDVETGTLYLWCPDGASPDSHTVEIKVRERGFEVRDLDEIHLIGFHFFGTTFSFENTVHSVVDDCHLLFPTFARELTDLDADPKPAPQTRMSGSHNTIRNCSLAYTPLSGLVMVGPDNTLDNNLVHDVCWNGSLRYPAINLAEERPSDKWKPTLVKSNTVYNCGSAGITFRGQAYVIEYNYVHDLGLTSNDVAGIYTSGAEVAGSVVRYNWVHGCHPESERGQHIGLGIRLDDQGRDFSVHHNVVWDCGLDAIVVKGEYNYVYNNTVLHLKPELRYASSIRLDTEPEPYKAWRRDHPLLGEQNAHTLVFNNVVGLIRAEYKKDTPFENKSNAIHNALTYSPELVDPAQFEFAPRAGSSLIDAGIAMPGLTDDFEGNAPDIGAYEYGGTYWRPGYRPRMSLFARDSIGDPYAIV